MLEISPEKIAHVIIRAREYDSGVNAWAHSGYRKGHGTQTELSEFIASLNEDEQASLVAVMWIGRDTFGPEDLAEAIETAKRFGSEHGHTYINGVLDHAAVEWRPAEAQARR